MANYCTTAKILLNTLVAIAFVLVGVTILVMVHLFSQLAPIHAKMVRFSRTGLFVSGILAMLLGLVPFFTALFHLFLHIRRRKEERRRKPARDQDGDAIDPKQQQQQQQEQQQQQQPIVKASVTDDNNDEAGATVSVCPTAASPKGSQPAASSETGAEQKTFLDDVSPRTTQPCPEKDGHVSRKSDDTAKAFSGDREVSAKMRAQPSEKRNSPTRDSFHSLGREEGPQGIGSKFGSRAASDQRNLPDETLSVHRSECIVQVIDDPCVRWDGSLQGMIGILGTDRTGEMPLPPTPKKLENVRNELGEKEECESDKDGRRISECNEENYLGL